MVDTSAINGYHYGEMILIDFPIGETKKHQAHIAYFPNGRVLGLSKFARLLEVFARRLQLQERLGHQLAEALNQLLDGGRATLS